MDYNQTAAYLEAASVFGSKYGLDSIRELLKRLSNPQDSLKFVHIAGTNGKGSVLSYLASVFQTAGYITGQYSSPALKCYRENIQVDGRWIEEESVTRHIRNIKKITDQMLSEGLPHPTRFEIETALAFLYFKERKCSIVLLETGLGGLNDATNVVQTTLAEIITSVSMDHMAVLGGTIEEIARQKAGIIKPKTAVISVNQNPCVIRIIEEVCAAKNCSLTLADTDRLTVIADTVKSQIFDYKTAGGTIFENLEIHMAGAHQLQNAAAAIEAVERLGSSGFTVSKAQLKDGLSKAVRFGRFTILKENPLFIADGAHNIDAAKRLKETIAHYFKGKRLIFLLGVFGDKEYEKIAELTAPLADRIITVNMPENKRLLSAEKLKETVLKFNKNTQASKSVADAVSTALSDASTEDVIIAFGSLSFLDAAAGQIR